jgi:glycosyltransferase involved in cell wall biosynthesis
MVPSKFFGILASGRPVIHVGPASGEVARVIVETGCGVVVDPGNVEALVEVMCRLRDQPDWRRDIGDRALKAATDLYSRRAALARWAEVVERIGGEVTTS